MRFLKFALLAVSLYILGSATTPALFASGLLQERNGVLCAAIPYANCIEIWNGWDIIVYSDEATTQKFLLDGATGTMTLSNGEQINNTTDGFVGYTGGQLWSTTTTTATNGSTITPTVYTLYNLDSAAAVTVTLAACTEGGPIILAGDDANNITIADSNIRTNDGAAAVIGQYDVFVAICVDTEWLEIANATNS
jgi:hypothetical protein